MRELYWFSVTLSFLPQEAVAKALVAGVEAVADALEELLRSDERFSEVSRQVHEWG